MDDFLNKTNELAGLVSTLQQQGEDNSDLRGIIAQLQAAVAKRNPPGTSEESTPMIFEAKIEPVEPAIQVPADAITTLNLQESIPATSNKTEVTKPKRKTKGRTATNRRNIKTTSKVPRKKRKVAKKIKVEISSEDEFSDYYDVEDQDSDGARNFDMNATIASLINPWTGALRDEELSSMVMPNDSGAASGTTSMQFNGTCKLCEVKSSIESGEPESGMMITSDTSLDSRFPVYASLVSFAAHLKSEHVEQAAIVSVKYDNLAIETSDAVGQEKNVGNFAIASSYKDSAYSNCDTSTGGLVKPIDSVNASSPVDVTNVNSPNKPNNYINIASLNDPASSVIDINTGISVDAMETNNVNTREIGITDAGSSNLASNDGLYTANLPSYAATLATSYANATDSTERNDAQIGSSIMGNPPPVEKFGETAAELPLTSNNLQEEASDPEKPTQDADITETINKRGQHNLRPRHRKIQPVEKEAPSKSEVIFLACPHCKKRYNMHGTAKSCYDQLVFHMHRKHAEALPSHVTLYSCQECPFQTLRRRDLTRHNYVVHTDHESRGVPCEICGKCVLPTSMVFHMAAVHGAEDVPEQVKARTAKAPCTICGKEFRGEINLQRHIKCVHNKVKDQLCHLCSQSFFAKRELQLHMFATHKINMSNMRVFTCPTEGCNYETLARRHLFIHSSVHTETKEFTCEHCGKAFKSKPALTQHLRIMHTNDVEYRCPKCPFTSHAKQYVQRHMVIHSAVKRHRCDFEECTYATHFIENLTKHKKKHRSKEFEDLKV